MESSDDQLLASFSGSLFDQSRAWGLTSSDSLPLFLSSLLCNQYPFLSFFFSFSFPLYFSLYLMFFCIRQFLEYISLLLIKKKKKIYLLLYGEVNILVLNTQLLVFFSYNHVSPCLHSFACTMPSISIPSSYKQTLSSSRYKHIMDKEMSALYKNQTWEHIALPLETNSRLSLGIQYQVPP